jgi:hypothetical protein
MEGTAGYLEHCFLVIKATYEAPCSPLKGRDSAGTAYAADHYNGLPGSRKKLFVGIIEMGFD